MPKNNLCKCCNRLFFYEGYEPDYCDSCSLKPDLIKKPIVRKHNQDPRLSRIVGKVIDKETGTKVALTEKLI